MYQKIWLKLNRLPDKFFYPRTTKKSIILHIYPLKKVRIERDASGEHRYTHRVYAISSDFEKIKVGDVEEKLSPTDDGYGKPIELEADETTTPKKRKTIRHEKQKFAEPPKPEVKEEPRQTYESPMDFYVDDEELF